jgi:hypothetical protein
LNAGRSIWQSLCTASFHLVRVQVVAGPNGNTEIDISGEARQGRFDAVNAFVVFRRRHEQLRSACPPHSVKQRYENYDRALKNDLEFELPVIDAAFLDAVGELGWRGIPINHANLQFDLRRYYPPIYPTLMRCKAGLIVTAPDLYSDEITYAIWSAVPAAFKTETGEPT